MRIILENEKTQIAFTYNAPTNQYILWIGGRPVADRRATPKTFMEALVFLVGMENTGFKLVYKEAKNYKK